MSVAIIYSRAQDGINAPLVTVEVHLSRGLPGFTIVGLPETTVKESKERVRSAILNNQFEFPLSRITINLAPADLPKEGGRFDLPIALGILIASGQIPEKGIEGHEVIGELSLTGELRSVTGVLPVSMAMKQSQRSLILPMTNADEAALVEESICKPAIHLLEVCAHITGTEPLKVHQRNQSSSSIQYKTDLNDIYGHEHAKRALEIAATGGHNLLMVGPPGSGKTMLAERMPTIMPPMTEEQALESAAIASISRHGFSLEFWKQRIIRSPHHSASSVALVGGGSHPKPGEISLAHNGILFLDELPEFDRKVLEVLREPLESGRIVISRAAKQVEYPANFQLIAAMNPCPCGYLGDKSGRCRCTEEQINRYQQKISGPLMDRIDMVIEVNSIPNAIINQSKDENAESSTTIRERVMTAFNKQLNRSGFVNSELKTKDIEKYCKLSDTDKLLLQTATTKLGLSGRAIHRVMKVARTIADLSNSKTILTQHLSEAISYRQKVNKHQNIISSDI
ncbi:MAG: YifB family Mg chelatase-like AAA ATPase [Proteobacteria bacterium]|nr:ATP-dependent protease [Pseudomonadota bacterium]NOG59867.1 YifB family Mg chelatase-like AAA ATPase [Pseudomonadota bacterium]